MGKTIEFLLNDDPELQVAWQQFEDPVMHNPATGEYLQYMGTVARPGDGFVDGGYVHQFRHRAVPGTNTRQYWNIPATHGWKPTP